ncbi:protein CUSTOS isoform X2 [Halichoerus grypus]|uniref:protein CUSTOS isoform X2 n=1 Tax=Phoca vitulina TaxID=9720 RepID=UPI00139643E9|nr:protein CUSTOS isoform X2 [Phoca vitulina]XP_035975592.1 protein CUSTOS isoform X2 [Halichoerus grypus]
MAAPCGTLSDLESSSSSEAEELARCREAAMPAWGLAQRQGGPEKPRADVRNNQRPATQPSLRHKVDEHEQDGNELQTTPEFRAHVAKKLGALLDSSITISEVVKEPAKAEVQKVPAEDDGFRLFFTSVPGGSEQKAAPQPGRKRLPSGSSEDSEEEWQRCREAAVSASDILQQSAIHGPIRVDGEAKKKKKKLRKKAKKEASTDLVAATTTTSGTAVGKPEKQSPQLNGDHASLGTKKKRRKKKAKKANEASPFPPTKNAVAMPAN